MKKYILLIILFIPLFYLIGWSLFLNHQRAQGTDIKVSITGYDPRDLLSGHYIAYQIDWEKTDCQQFSNGICPQKEFCSSTYRGRECHFYVPEKQASLLDSLLRQRNNNPLRFEMVYSYTPGLTPMAKQLLINGQAWQDYLVANPAQ